MVCVIKHGWLWFSWKTKFSQKPFEFKAPIVFFCVEPYLIVQVTTFFCVTAAFRRSPSGNNWHLQSSPHLGLSQGSRFVPQFRVLPFRFVQAGFHTVHPTGKLSNVVLIACPLRPRSFQLTERYLKGQQSILRSLVSGIPGWCLLYPLQPQEVRLWARTGLGLRYPR